MNESGSSIDSGALDEIAAEWLYEREEGFTPERAKAFVSWCASDSRHLQAVSRIERTWGLLNEMTSVRTSLAVRIALNHGTPKFDASSSNLRYRGVTWAAGMAAAVVLGWVFWHGVGSPQAIERYKTDDAVQRTLVLSDGSVMDLNIGSEVSVKFTDAQRRLTLLRGEAHFEVAHNAARPFIVTAGGVSVRAVGTAFDVRMATKDVNVLVVEGKVEVSREPAILELTRTIVSPSLQAGECAEVSLDNRLAAARIDKVDAPSIRSMLTWQNPMTSFTDVPLRDVVVRFNRRNSTQLVLRDADLGERKIGGMIALDQVDAFVRLLVQDGDIVAERQTGGKIILRHVR